ncbi:uncharacterized protein CTRU02_213831 [Colletotrichum truncatum]|uniref:Uncharacterized protein n=1 Tax=Colletotrichum truncatum TaxID=5467 RepID=A0ACC3YGX4_COLTU|nr:uncharacterized protein CTRU02_12853 [Colletotrichum truncatum]KAF6784086.1 hypothetical protein CTRU02_12853 [Colletotrichum truncatum]
MSYIIDGIQGRSLPKIETIQNGPISSLVPFGSLLLVSSVVVVVLIANILERWLLRKVYGEVYITLERPENEKRRRSFTYYHVGAVMMFALLCIGVYPVMRFLVGNAALSTPLVPGRRIRIGDVLFTVSQTYSAYYVFELCFRTQFASPLSIAHHIGLLAITQTALSLFGNFAEHPEATIEFYMCMVWGKIYLQRRKQNTLLTVDVTPLGAFDVVVELPIYVSMIVWRARRGDHRLLSYMVYGCFGWILLGATLETAITIYLLHRSWDRWGRIWRVITPLIFSLWISTQLYGASRLFLMARSEQRKCGNGMKREPERLGTGVGSHILPC